MQRDLSIDLVRGAGILMIAVDHLAGVAERLTGGVTVNPFPTWTRLGWSSAAEFFVFFSGYLIGLVYAQTLRAQGPAMLYVRALHRSWQIYVANVLTLCAVLLLLHTPLFGNEGLDRFVSVAALGGGDAMTGLVSFLSLQSAPPFFEILQLYVVLLVVAPLLLLIARASVIAVVLSAAALWLCVQLDPSLNLAEWNFNPFAWQLVFVLGMMCSVGDLFARLRALVPRRSLIVGCGAFLGAALVIKTIDKAGWSLPLIGAIDVAGIDKGTLGSLRLLHFLVSVVFVMQIVPSTAVIERSLAARAIASIGQYSLECFCISTVLVFAAVGLLSNAGELGPLALLPAGAVVVVLVCLFAPAVRWIKAQPWRGTKNKPAKIEHAAPTPRPMTLGDVP